MKIEKMLETMDVPRFRRNLKKEENIQWLLRNLALRNSNHPYFEMTIEALKEKLMKRS